MDSATKSPTDHRFEKLARAPAYLKVSEAIEADILRGTLAEGTMLPTETQLCDQFGVTRSTVREGIRLLETSGLLARGPAKRLIVRRPKTGDIALSTSRALTFSGITFKEAWESLALFQPQLAAQAATKFSKKDLEKLKAVHALLGDTKSEDYNLVVMYTDEFFAALAAGLKNRVTMALSQTLNMLIDASLRQVIASVPDGRKRILKAQKELIAAIEDKDPERARKWMVKHIDDLQRGYTVARISMDAKIA